MLATSRLSGATSPASGQIIYNTFSYKSLILSFLTYSTVTSGNLPPLKIFLINVLYQGINSIFQTNMGMVTLIDVLKKLNLKLEAETEMRLQLEEKVDRQQQEPVLGLIQGLH